MYKIGFIKLNPHSPCLFQFPDQFTICLAKLSCKIPSPFFTDKTDQFQKCKWSCDNRFGFESIFLCFQIFVHQFISRQRNRCIVLDLRNHIMIVGVKPFLHRQRFYIPLRSLITARHRKIRILLR